MQLQKNFKFSDAAAIVSYLDDLGISHLYLSPLLEAREGSNHGYDAIDIERVSEERGGEKGFAQLAAKVASAKSLDGIILDIVPNHVAASSKNPAWWEVLKEGRNSKYWSCFDIRPRNSKDHRIVLPVLGRTRQSVMASRELSLSLANQQLVLKYFDNIYPVSHASYANVLKRVALLFTVKTEHGRAWQKKLLALAQKKNGVEKALAQWLLANPSAHRALTLTLKALPLKVVESTLNEQNYTLEEWKAGSREVNYRRFFDINDLAAVRVEDEKVFKWSHAKIASLQKQYPIIHGLRVDHVDGLTDPQGYLKRLSRLSKNVWVEKILGEGETVPKNWITRGTTGYEFSGLSSRLFVALPGLLHLHAHYTRHVDQRWERFHECVYDSKREMLDSHFVAELTYLTDGFYAVSQRSRGFKFTRDEMREALSELTASLRVYRTYKASLKHGASQETGTRWLTEAFAEVEGRGRLTSKSALKWLRSLLLDKGDWSESTYDLIRRWEQLTGPVMAKGLEDTALYRYFPLLSLNVVGGEPDWTGDGAIEFHAFNQERLRERPHAMSTTSTHDTKRSEDVRSRIHVISEKCEEWTSLFETWHRARHSHGLFPEVEASTEYLIYETLLGAWPLKSAPDDVFLKRMKEYFTKAVREAKSQTSWIEPNTTYENAVHSLVQELAVGESTFAKTFRKAFVPFVEKCTYFGAWNSLGLLTLKVMSPGLPDFYQGCEMWDDSLVDPDNRRAVDYKVRKQALSEIKKSKKALGKNMLPKLREEWKSGEIKLWLTHELLELRRIHQELFTEGEYYPLDFAGTGRASFVGFLRNYKDRWAMVIVPRSLSSREKLTGNFALQSKELLETEVILPPQAPRNWQNAFFKETLHADRPTIREVMKGEPVAVWLSAR